MHRFATFTAEEIFAYMEAKATGRARDPQFAPYAKLKVNSDRLRLFKLKGAGCVTCDLVGSFFALESHGDENPHLNLYAIGANGREVLMTKDHIRPKAKGGLNVMENYQPMCADCNGAKADKYDG